MLSVIFSCLREIHILDIQKQIERFKKGYPFRRLIRPATVGDGIRKLGEDKSRVLQRKYDDSLSKTSVCKFVPASGVASRMFRELNMLREVFSSDEAVLDPEGEKILEKFTSNLTRFPFAGLLEERFEEELGKVVSSGNCGLVLDVLLETTVWVTEIFRKGLYLFTATTGSRRRLFASISKKPSDNISSRGTVSMHFTISPAFAEQFALEERMAAPLFSSEWRFHLT